MSSQFTALQRTRFRLYLRILAVSAVIGAAYGVMIAKDEVSRLAGSLSGVVNAVLIAGSIAAIEIFLLREDSSMNRLLRVPFVVLVAAKTLVYSAIVVAVVTGPARLGRPLDAYTEMVTVGFSIAITAIFVITLQAASLIGRRTFRDLVLGRYREPRAERRFFLFVDVVGSTAIAERLGALDAHRFLAAVFSATAEPIAACRGEIYQYVGDEIVVTWTEIEGKPEARPLRCYFDMKAALAARAAEFRARYGAEPDLRAALHLGEVIVGEVGEQRRAIVFHGDVMNTASRLEHATRDLGVRFIASADALHVLGPTQNMVLTDLGAVALRGRQEPIRASGIALRN
ncbi:MAG: adenylate/guanylate cyclase domain-containing protein [Betaproteobacteria bacterium]|nr:MAG: adenylate/guanylate cyclase domain-containing protein [Betaproteobacteria bacterium]